MANGSRVSVCMHHLGSEVMDSSTLILGPRFLVARSDQIYRRQSAVICWKRSTDSLKSKEQALRQYRYMMICYLGITRNHKALE